MPTGDQERGHCSAQRIGTDWQIKRMMWGSGLGGISMQKKLQTQTKKTSRWGIFILLALMACGSVLTFAYAQSRLGSAFNLNSPASFPVDI